MSTARQSVMRLLFLLCLSISLVAAFVPHYARSDDGTAAASSIDASPETSLSVYDAADAAASATSLSLADSSISPAGIGKGTLLLSLKNRLIYFISARIASILVRTVIAQLEKHNIIGKQDKATIDFITGALEKITIIILTMALIASVPGTQIVELGADAGGKVKRSALLLNSPVHATSWDLSDDEAHAAANSLYKRDFIHDDLRSDMLSSGVSNVTILHDPYAPSDIPVLAYRGEDDKMHFHWRSAAETPTPEGKGPKKGKGGDTLYTHHYPFFAAGGAGFKISAHTPIAPHVSAASDEDAKQIAKVIVADYLKNRAGASMAGYTEKYKDTGLKGHKLCYIAEDKKFGLKDEFDKCFGKEK